MEGMVPFETALSRALAPVRRLDESVRDFLATRSENELLRAENEALRARRRAFADLEREIAELRTLLGFRDAAELTTVPARVIAIAPSNFEWTLTIDAGEEDGVERGMAVVAAEGLVGRVLMTTDRAARVLLVVDPNFSVASRSVATSAVGLLDGGGNEPMRFAPLDPRQGVEPDDEIVTATFPGSAVPSGIPIGRIVAQDERSSRLSAAYDLLPFVDVTRLDHVLVVLAGPAEDVPGFEDSDALDVPMPDVATPDGDATTAGAAG